jgi:hypothetical protein
MHARAAGVLLWHLKTSLWHPRAPLSLVCAAAAALPRRLPL